MAVAYMGGRNMQQQRCCRVIESCCSLSLRPLVLCRPSPLAAGAKLMPEQHKLLTKHPRQCALPARSQQ